jgi:hypothetical protein
MNETYRVPWPVIKLPFGHMAEHPLRLQLSEGSDKGIWDLGSQTLSRERFYRI